MRQPARAVEIFENEYLARGSEGLNDFVKLRIGSAAELVKTVQAHPKYFASLRAQTARIDTFKPRIRASFFALKYLYPDAVFPSVYFVIGRMNSGGTTSDRGLLIGAEMYGRTPDMPLEELSDWHKQVLAPVDGLPHIVAHELIHFQQKVRGPDRDTLLAVSIREGAADFLAELISGAHINQHPHEYGNPREGALWAEFKREMHGTKLDNWLFNGNRSKDRPADLGYYIGYKIVAHYYMLHLDKRQAVYDILNIRNYAEFLKASRYEERWGG